MMSAPPGVTAADMDPASHDLPIFFVSSVVQRARSNSGQSCSGSDPVAVKTWSLDHPSSGQFITPAPCRRDTTSSGQLLQSESRGLINMSPGQSLTPTGASSEQCLSSGQSRVDSHRSDMTSHPAVDETWSVAHPSCDSQPRTRGIAKERHEHWTVTHTWPCTLQTRFVDLWTITRPWIRNSAVAWLCRHQLWTVCYYCSSETGAHLGL